MLSYIIVPIYGTLFRALFMLSVHVDPFRIEERIMGYRIVRVSQIGMRRVFENLLCRGYSTNDANPLRAFIFTE